MPIELTWFIPDRILLSRWIGHVNEEDMLVLVDEIGIILDTAQRPIHTIIDMSEVADISPNAAYSYIQSRIPTHPRRGRVCLVATTFHIQVMADTLNRISQLELFHLCASRNEARDFLFLNDTQPPPLQLDADDDLNPVDDPTGAAS
jgi:hypothetical protein